MHFYMRLSRGSRGAADSRSAKDALSSSGAGDGRHKPEPDQRHQNLIGQECALEGANDVLTPGEDEPRRKEGENEEELEEAEAPRYRAILARSNYLAADRPDIMYATKELCRSMARPTAVAWHRLKRLGRYLVGSSRPIMEFDWQVHENEVTGYSDSDWAGCRVTGWPTSGGDLMIGATS